MKATLALENGLWYEGEAAGADGETGGEVVFNTSMTGYQEVLTDPSYAGQIVTMTCPEIGNYGVSPEDGESRAPQVAGFIVRDESPVASNWRAGRDAARLPRPTQHRRDLRHRHARADARAALGRRDARRHRDRRGRSPQARGQGARDAADGRIGSRARRHVRGGLRLEPRGRRRVHATRGAAAEAPAAGRRLRLRDEVEHPAPAERARLRRARVSGDDARRGAAGDEPRRRVPEQRPRRSGAARRTRSTTRRRWSSPTCRCSASASATRFSASRWAARRSS